MLIMILTKIKTVGIIGIDADGKIPDMLKLKNTATCTKNVAQAWRERKIYAA